MTSPDASPESSGIRGSKPYVVATAFFALLAIVGFALYGLPFLYDFFVKEFGWSRTVVTSGNALGKLIIAPLFGFLAGRVLMGMLADLFPMKYVMILIYIVVGASIPLLLMPDFPGRLYVFAVIFGIGLGGDYMIIPLMAGDLFGVKMLGRVMGIILVADGIAESLSPMMVGALYNEPLKSYTFGFTVLINIAMTGALIVSFLPLHGTLTENQPKQ